MPDDGPLPDLEILLGLPLWQGSISWEPLTGGITNRNYLIRHTGESCVARVGQELPALGVDRRNERLCHGEAERLGVAPPIHFARDGILITRYVPGRTLDVEGAKAPGFAEKLAALLRGLHEGWDEVRGELLYFSPFQSSRTYAETARNRGARLPGDIEAILAAARGFSRRIFPFVPTLCHNDMLPANILDEDGRLWIVDWEYAGIGNPLFDLAGVSANCRFSEEEDRAFLTSYRGEMRAQDLADLCILKAGSLLREALWSVVQTVESDLDFDFETYADVHFERFRQAIAALGPG